MVNMFWRQKSLWSVTDDMTEHQPVSVLLIRLSPGEATTIAGPWT